MKKRIFAFILFVLVHVGLKAQYDAQFSQYWASKTYYNPASVGSTDGVNATIINRQQWVGMTNAPKSLFAGADLPFTKWGKNHGIGINLFSDNIGLFGNSSILLNYAYKLKLWRGDLSIGTQVGFVNQNFDGTKINLKDFTDAAHSSNDPAIPTTSVQAMSFDMGLGAYYTTDKGYAGLSLTHLFEPSFDFDEKTSTYAGRIMYLMGGLSIPVEGYPITLLPSTFIKSDFRVFQVDLTLRAEVNNLFWGGISYRWNDAIVAMSGVRFKNVSIGYSYDISTSKLFTVTKGSHELFASYNFELQLKRKSERKSNKSLRYL